MRMLPLALAILPLQALADTFTVTAPPTSVTAFASGAIVTRSGRVDLPAGTHTLRITDMDPDTYAEAMDITVAGATILSRSWDGDPDTPYRAPRTPEYLAAKASLEAAEEALAMRDDAIVLALAKAQAAEDQIAFLNGITLPEEAATDVDTLRAIGQLIASDGTAARSAMRAAEAEARALRRGREDLEFAVAEARAALQMVTPPNDAPATLSMDVTVPEDTAAEVTVRYLSEAVTWKPIYTMHLQNGDTLRVERGAMIEQYSNEDWINVSMTLSTLAPTGNTSPGTLWPLLRRIEDTVQPEVGVARLRSQSTFADGVADPIIEAPVVVEEATAPADFDGIGVTYALPTTVTVPAGGATVQVALDTVTFDATLSARAVPRLNATAFRQVSFENTSPEILLPGEAILYVDDQVVGSTSVASLPPNANTEIFFGPIEGLRLTRTVLDRNEGDRGLITRSNEQREAIRLEIENLTDRDWPVALRESVPFSEQEDLVIAWTATPPPDVEAVDDRRGILEWKLDMAPGQTQLIEVETTLTWPEDKVLR